MPCVNFHSTNHEARCEFLMNRRERKAQMGGRLSIVLFRDSMIFFKHKNCYFFQVVFFSSPSAVCDCLFSSRNIQIEIRLTRCLLNPNDRYIKYLFAFFCVFGSSDAELRYEK